MPPSFSFWIKILYPLWGPAQSVSSKKPPNPSTPPIVSLFQIPYNDNNSISLK